MRGNDATEIERTILKAMDSEQRHLGGLERSTIGGIQRATFTAQATTKGHARLKKMLRECECVNEVLSFHSSEDD